MICKNCNNKIPDDSMFCPSCGQKAETEPVATVETKNMGKIPKFPKKGIVAAAVVALLLAVVLIVGFASNWFGLTGPAMKIASAAEKTFTAGNYTVDIKCTYSSEGKRSTSIKGTANVAIDFEKREFTLFTKLTASGETAIVAIYDGFCVIDDTKDRWRYDISEQLDAYFDAYEEGAKKEFSWEDFIDNIFYEGAYEEAAKDINFDKLEKCIKNYAKKLNNEKWLEKNAGYTTEEDDGVTMYCFNPDVYLFLTASMPVFENAFINEDRYDELNEDIAERKSSFKHINMNLAYGIKDGELIRFDVKIIQSDGSFLNNRIRIEADFRDIGSTEFDIDQLEDMLDQANWTSNRYQ